MVKPLWWAILWLFSASIALAQVRPTQQSSFASRPITLREGEIIVNAAWERERQTASKPDCSHLVHEVYSLAGYPYPYADSFDLYIGTKGFVRVVKPQPGDLIVWRGHVGIVVDPGERSFYSSVTSGLHTEFYDAPEWKARGQARFYRYAAVTRGNVTQTNVRLPRPAKESVQVIAAPEIEGLDGNASAVVEPMKKSANSRTTASPNVESPSVEPTSEVPLSIVVAASLERPTEAEIADAISELNNGSGNILRREELSQLDRKVIVYDSLTVARTTFKGNRGSALTRIRSQLTLPGEGVERKPHYENFRWELLRVNGGWEVLVPKDRVYVPRDVAVRMLAARLASLAQNSGGSGSDSSLRQQAQIVHALDALFDER
jgi:hypothetical protein